MADQDQPTAVKDPVVGVAFSGDVKVEQHHADGGAPPPKVPDPPPVPAPVANAPPINFEQAQIYKTLRAHLVEANHPEAPVRHMTVSEHAELRGYKLVPEKDAQTGAISMQPSWQMRALVGRFGEHGLDHDVRIASDKFDEALHEALHGRI